MRMSKKALIGFVKRLGITGWVDVFEEDSNLEIQQFLDCFEDIHDLKAFLLEDETPDPLLIEREEMEETFENDLKREEWYYQY